MEGGRTGGMELGGVGGRRDKLRVEGGISGISGRHQLNVRNARETLPSFRVGGEERGVVVGRRGRGR